MVEAAAVRIEGKGEADVLSIGSLQVADPGPSQVLIEVEAAGLNRADILQRRGHYPAPPGVPADVPGLEYAGKVAAVGDGVSHRKVGDRVMGIVAGGGMASHLVCHERETIAVPEGMRISDAAAIPEVYLTAYDALFVQGGLSLGQRVLLHSVGSGVGTAALQLCKVAGATAIGTSRSQDKLERCEKLGLHVGVLAEDKQFAKAVLEATGGAGVDLILDTVGAAYLEDNLRCLTLGGTMIVIGLMGGALGSLALGALLNKRARIAGSVLRSRPLEEKIALAQRFERAVVPLLQNGALEPVVDRVMPMQEIAEAHRYLESNASFGKVVMTWS
ncbi:MAG: NAD(P)H-quinone oxidoreductase [Myxococcales bacterium]|nr:NAD(P)H-quinone oxidoreductase [Myxococcales bacterium]